MSASFSRSALQRAAALCRALRLNEADMAQATYCVCSFQHQQQEQHQYASPANHIPAFCIPKPVLISSPAFLEYADPAAMQRLSLWK